MRFFRTIWLRRKAVNQGWCLLSFFLESGTALGINLETSSKNFLHHWCQSSSISLFLKTLSHSSSSKASCILSSLLQWNSQTGELACGWYGAGLKQKSLSKEIGKWSDVPNGGCTVIDLKTSGRLVIARSSRLRGSPSLSRWEGWLHNWVRLKLSSKSCSMRPSAVVRSVSHQSEFFALKSPTRRIS